MLARLTRRQQGLLLALGTGVLSGFAVFFNGYGVRAWADVADPTTYTTFKNVIAAFVIGLVAVSRRNAGRHRASVTPGPHRLLWVIPILGGSVPFVLFFEGLSRASSSQAALIHKTLLIWVAALAVVYLRERLAWPHFLAIGLLVCGQVILVGGLGAFTMGIGEALILAATLMWSIEVVISKRLLAEFPSTTVSVARMAGGSVVLVAYALLRGPDIKWSVLASPHLVWMGLAGLLLSAYVLSWHAALQRAPAVDVTAVLLVGAVVTGLLEAGVRGVGLPNLAGPALVIGGVVILAVFSFRNMTPHVP